MNHIHSHAHGNNPTNSPAIFSASHEIMLADQVEFIRIQQALCQWIDEIKEWAKENSCLMGHIKVFVEGPQNLWLSSTGGSIMIRHSSKGNEPFAHKIHLNLTAIVFGTSNQDLQDMARKRLRVCLNSGL